MHLFDQRILGIAILFLLGMLILLIVLSAIMLTGEILHKHSENQSSFPVLGKSFGGLEYEDVTSTGRREGNGIKISG